MKIGFVSPYWESLGGGERYLLSLASHWSRKHEVLLLVKDDEFISKTQSRFGIDLTRIKLTRNFFLGRNLLTKVIQSKFYDLLVFITDGSLPTTMARRNLLHIQVPFPKIPEPDWKLKQFQWVICNSKFTRDHMDKRLRHKAQVIYPPVDTDSQIEMPKEKLILSVGRYSAHYRAKKHEVLISAFKELKKIDKYKLWKLIIVGGLMDSDQNYFRELKREADGDDIELLANVTSTELRELYAKAAVYWHAAGYGESDEMNMEHFGISVVEAMASGCVPIVYNGGGLPEIVVDGENGQLWNTIDELIEKTKRVIIDNSLSKLRKASKKTAGRFSLRRFNQEADKLIEIMNL